MPKVAADNSPLLERAVFGYDGTNYRVVKVDADGNLVAALKATQTIEVTQDTAADLLATVDVAAGQSIEVTQATAADLNATATLAADQNVQARGHGWISSAWKKNPLQSGYSGDWSEEKTVADATAGQNILSGTAVPAGEIWELQALVGMDIDTAPTSIQLQVSVNGVIVNLHQTFAPVAARWEIWTGKLTLSEGDFVRGLFNGVTLNDGLYVRYHAVRIDIDQ